MMEVFMYKVIMAPTDGSGFDREAVGVALRIAQRSHAKLRLVRVHCIGELFGMESSLDAATMPVNVLEQERNRIVSELNSFAAECRRTCDVEIEASVEDGPLPEALQVYANRNGVDLIVMSSHGRGRLARLSLGSVTDLLIRRTTIPVLVVKPHPGYLDSVRPDAFKRIVVPLDGSSAAEQILQEVATLAKVEQSELTLLRVVVPGTASQKAVAGESTPWWDKDVAAADAYLYRTADKLREDGFRTKTDVVIGGNIARSIADYAVRESADLIAMATHGRGGISRALRGSVADAVIRTSHTSMLVLRPAGKVAREVQPKGARLPDGASAMA
jgi:nucleotide-binding universal stress UspA family protein